MVIDRDVHIVRFALDRHGDGAPFLALLDADERARAAAFRFDRDRRRFTVAHGLMRTVLGAVLCEPPAKVAFTYGPYGKPRLEHAGNIRFNLSHSGERALLTVTSGREVGIDLEQEHEIDTLALATSCFSEREREALAATPADGRLKAFFRVWARKESFIKALGAGLSFPLAGFDVSLDEQPEQLLLDCSAAPTELPRWTMTTVNADPGYAAAITVEGRDWAPRYWDLPETDAEMDALENAGV